MYNSPILLQGRIHTLIDAGKNKKEILTNLSELLDSHTNDILLCDFDDTITTSGVSTEAYYRGYCCASWICQSRHAFSPLGVSVSREFLRTVPEKTDIVIITRNFLSLVADYSVLLGPKLEQSGIRIVGIIGKVPQTHLSLVTSSDKVMLMGYKRTLLTDIFEYHALRHVERCKFLPKPFRGSTSFVIFLHRLIKVRDFFRGFMSVFLPHKNATP